MKDWLLAACLLVVNSSVKWREVAPALEDVATVHELFKLKMGK